MTSAIKKGNEGLKELTVMKICLVIDVGPRGIVKEKEVLER